MVMVMDRARKDYAFLSYFVQLIEWPINRFRQTCELHVQRLPFIEIILTGFPLIYIYILLYEKQTQTNYKEKLVKQTSLSFLLSLSLRNYDQIHIVH